jgi:hypothetical protein
MDKNLFERNLLALSQRDPGLCSRLTSAQTTLGRYRFPESRSGEIIPALPDSSGTARPLHSMVDPRRESARLIGTLTPAEGFLVFLGLGGGYYPEMALEREDVQQALVIEYDINGVAELLASMEYIRLFNDPRFTLLVDPSEETLETCLLQTWQPVLHGGIRVLPLRPRTEAAPDKFGRAGETIKRTIEKLSADYSVQAYFGTRWFSNIVRNVLSAEKSEMPLMPVKRAAICAAGPSLDEQLYSLANNRANNRADDHAGSSEKPFIIAADTALPALLKYGLEPDAVISIDCQHISYYHFMRGIPPHTHLFLDLASPPLLASLSPRVRFFSGGHPLTRYISRVWRSFPVLDTSGANVTYAALSLADYLGAREIELYGADFSYPLGKTYARGTYINPYFAVRQNRLNPLEALSSAFLYRNREMRKIQNNGSWYYETGILKSYREGLEAKARAIDGTVIPVRGLGAPIGIVPKPERTAFYAPQTLRLFSPGNASEKAGVFLERYRSEIKNLPLPGESSARYIRDLGDEQKSILSTLLPAAAAIKRRKPELERTPLFEAVKEYCLRELDSVLEPQNI